MSNQVLCFFFLFNILTICGPEDETEILERKVFLVSNSNGVLFGKVTYLFRRMHILAK